MQLSNKLSILLMVLILSSIAYYPLTMALASPTPAITDLPTLQTSLPKLYTSGLKLYTEDGQEFKIRAVSLHYIGAEPDHSSPQHITQSDIQKIKTMGFNTVRMHIYWGVLQPTGPDSVNETAFTSTEVVEPAGVGLDSIVNWCAESGLYIILNPIWLNTGPAPQWAVTLSGGVGQTAGDQSEVINLLGNPQVQAGVNYFYRWMAQHYALYNNVIFESFNEVLTPSPSDGGAPFANFNHGWVSAIEQGEGANSHLKIIEYLLTQSSWAPIFTAPYISQPDSHSNVLLASHDYYPMNSWNPTTDIQKVQNSLQSFANAAHSVDRPWINTEWSKSIDQPQWQSFYTTTLQCFESYGATGWAYWCYCSEPAAQMFYHGTWNVNNQTVYSQVYPILSPYLTSNGISGTLDVTVATNKASSSKSPSMITTVNVKDATGSNPLSGAQVSLSIYDTRGRLLWSGSKATDASGQAQFTYKTSARSFKIVADVSLSGYLPKTIQATYP